MIDALPPVEFRFIHDRYEERSIIPRDFAGLSGPERAKLVHELRDYLPAPFNGLPDHLVLSIVAGLPGPQMGGGSKVKTVELITSGSSFTVFRDWNRSDNIIHALAHGGKGGSGAPNGFGGGFGGGGGGGSAWAALVNKALTRKSVQSLSIGASDTWFITSATLLAKGGSNGNTPNSGAGGLASASIGDLKASGGNGGTGSSTSTSRADGGDGGGAGGPHGAGSGVTADGGSTAGLNPGGATNPKPGNGGSRGTFAAASVGSVYGGGGGGGSSAVTSGANGAVGCILVINNASL